MNFVGNPEVGRNLHSEHPDTLRKFISYKDWGPGVYNGPSYYLSLLGGSYTRFSVIRVTWSYKEDCRLSPDYIPWRGEGTYPLTSEVFKKVSLYL